jgi:hypothetical protein
VLAADSRVTITAQRPGPANTTLLLPATYDTATKLLKVTGQNYVAAVTYGLGALGGAEPRTAHSFLPELEEELADSKVGRLGVEDFAKRLGEFYGRQYTALMPVGSAMDMIFLVGGFDAKAAYGRVFEVKIPSNPDPVEQNPGQQFGPTIGGQTDIIVRMLRGFDQRTVPLAKDHLQLTDPKASALESYLKDKLGLPVPFQFLPLQDCVDLAIFLIRATITMQRWMVDIRGVGGAIDVATIVRTTGFHPVQQKEIVGEAR